MSGVEERVKEFLDNFWRVKERAMKPFNADDITLENFEGIFKCRKKPVIVHALQMNFPEGFTVTSKEGVLTGKPGDYLMWGVRGEKYICEKEIFEETYVRVKE